MNATSRGLRVVAVAVVVLAATLLGLSQSSAAVREGPPAVAVVHVSSGPMVTGPAVNGLRLRSRGSFHGRVKGLLYRGDRMRVVGWHGPWVEVQLTRRSASGLHAGSLGWSWRGYMHKPRVCPPSYVCKHW